ncbi:probable ubiquitin carboxyl-terminal hydrolase MINDY-4 [Salarias fasciatus]|uniref:probable ubiquitin carboxyl-terminal hydrolase MINDY-4 n=1 Tax=Salarias fasciatus TaxID=181472 RepID=UPI001176FEC1|nr:probable ubiquitin carboxyl-terminal hydrolase MINDY-4 [Salarias fasciatus]
MVASVEEVSSSLVREYLSRKGLKRTMACLEEELPRTEASINNRYQLRQMLSIENLYRKNKVQNSPLKTLLEIIVKHHMEQLNHNKIMINESNSLQSATNARMISKTSAQTPTVICGLKAEENTSDFGREKKTDLRSAVQETCASKSTNKSPLPEKCWLSSHNQTDILTLDLKDRSLVTFLQDSESFIQKEPEKNAFIIETPQRSRTNRIRRGMMAGPIPQESNRKRHSRKAEVPQSRLRKEEETRPSQDGLLPTDLLQKSSLNVMSSPDCEGEKEGALSPLVNTDTESTFEKVQQNITKTKKVKIKSNCADLNLSEMVLDDIDDESLSDLSKRSLLTTPTEHNFVGHQIDQHTAMELKAVLLGSGLNCFSAEWRNQGFAFSETFDLRYGIVQKKGGPCGVLASIQAFVLKILLFENTEICNNPLQQLKPSNATRRRCLVLALAEILWRAGEEKQATIAINSGRTQFISTRHYKSDGVLEKIMCFTVDNIKDVQLLLEQHIEQFETGAFGCLLLTVSAVLSRSIEKVREDMDVPTTTLIGAHGYCTQELVNLLLCGRSVSNVFDNEMDLDSGNGNVTLLKGIRSQCDVGLLSLFEHYNICKVGAHLKSPRFPIWVVCSESHFSVLFGLQRELLTCEDRGLEFDLYYYDGLANQQEEIRLTVSLGKMTTSSSHDVDTDLIPPLDLCIKTRWKDASVNWNDTEPIL